MVNKTISEQEESPMDIPDALKQAAIQLQRELGDVYISRSKLKQRALEIMSECGREVSEGSIIPSDYCYNREQKGGRKRKFFLWQDGGLYRYVGEGYSYTGEVIRKPQYR